MFWSKILLLFFSAIIISNNDSKHASTNDFVSENIFDSTRTTIHYNSYVRLDPIVLNCSHHSVAFTQIIYFYKFGGFLNFQWKINQNFKRFKR